jgi:DNA-binding beta-propeller fold protein YncE
MRLAKRGATLHPELRTQNHEWTDKKMRTLGFALPMISIAMAASVIAAGGYHLIQRIPIPGGLDWDYMAIDAAARRLYVSHDKEVVVIDTDTNRRVGAIAVTEGAHGTAIASEFGRGFISKTDPGSVTIFDTKTLRPIKEVRVGDDPNCILYDRSTRRVFTADRGSKQVTAIDAQSGNVAGTIGPLDGKVEYAASDEAGHVFINMQDKNTVLDLDAKALKVLHTWPVAPCEQPTSMAIDRPGRRLFIGCRSGVMAVMDASSGRVVTTLPIGKGVDATAYDADAHLVFDSNGDGTMTVVKQDSADRYRVIENVSTQQGARTMAIDSKTHRAFLVAATTKPGSFTVLVLAP